MSQPSSIKIISIKLLLSNNLAGSLIGIGGKTIKELMETTGTKVHISSNSDPYPGTSDRVVVINGDFNSVNLAQSLIWEMIALAACTQNPRGVEWSPKDLHDNMGQNDSVEVSGKLTIPAAAGGLLIGKGGANIQGIAEQSGATVSMSGKEEAIFTHERVMTLSGTLASCVECTKLILQKLNEPAELIQYVNRGTTYAVAPAPLNAYSMPYGMPPAGSYGGYGTGIPSHPAANGMGLNRSGGSRSGFHHQGGVNELDNQVTPVETTITFTVPDELVGNILGKQVKYHLLCLVCAILPHFSFNASSSGLHYEGNYRHLQSQDHRVTQVTLPYLFSDIMNERLKCHIFRGESAEGSGGSSNRVVTITGSLNSAQTAHVLITQRLQVSAYIILHCGTKRCLTRLSAAVLPCADSCGSQADPRTRPRCDGVMRPIGITEAFRGRLHSG